MAGIRASMAAIMAAFSQNIANLPGVNFAQFASQFSIKKSSKGKKNGKMYRDWRNHYTTDWKDILTKDQWTGGGTKERERRVKQAIRNTHNKDKKLLSMPIYYAVK